MTSLQSPAVTAGTPLTTLGYTKFGPAGQQFSLLTTKTQRVSTTPAQNLVTTYSYNAANKFVLQNAVADSGGLNLTTTFTFDAVGNVSQIDGPRSDVTDVTGYQFDSMRRLKEVDGQLGAVTKYTYDLDGLLTQTQHALNSAGTLWQTEKRTYWPSGELRTVQSPNATGATDFTTSYDYDADGRLTTLTTPISAGATRVTSYQLDLDGHKLVEIRGAGAPGQITYGQWGYTDNGKLKFSEDGNGNRSGYSYDGLDRLAQMFLPSATVHVPSTTIFEKYDYDANGNLKTKTNRSGKTVTFTYDALDHETQRVVAANPAAHFARTLTTTYDLLGSKLVLTADGQTLTHAYDTAGRLKSVTDSAIGMVSYLRDPAGNRTQVKWPDGYFVAYGYDALNRMTTVSENGTTSIAAYSLGSLFRNSVTFGNSATMTWQFFNDGAPSSVTDAVGTKSVGFTFERNQADQMTKQSVAVTDPAAQLVPRSFLPVPVSASSTAYVPNFLDQYSSVAAVSKTYDLNGNLITDGTNTFEYDEENRLRTAGTSITYEYDPLGRRRAKTVSGTTTKFLSDGQEEIGEYSGSTLLRRYVYGPNIDERVAQVEASGTKTYFQTNHQGSTVLTTDAAQTVTAYNYGPYGETTSPATGVAFRFTGRRFDAETGLYYYRARYYSPSLGRFLQIDPVGYQDDLNLYAYVGNDPLNRVDPSGLTWAEFSAGVLQGTTDATEPVDFELDAAAELGVNSSSWSYQLGYGLGAGLAAANDPARGGGMGGIASTSARLVKPPPPGALQKMAERVRSAAAHPQAASRRTVAVGQRVNGQRVVSSSNGLDKGQRAAAKQAGLTVIPSKKGNHAEENIMEAHDDVTHIGTSKRDACGPGEHDCAGQMAERGIINNNAPQ